MVRQQQADFRRQSRPDPQQRQFEDIRCIALDGTAQGLIVPFVQVGTRVEGHDASHFSANTPFVARPIDQPFAPRHEFRQFFAKPRPECGGILVVWLRSQSKQEVHHVTLGFGSLRLDNIAFRTSENARGSEPVNVKFGIRKCVEQPGVTTGSGRDTPVELGKVGTNKGTPFVGHDAAAEFTFQTLKCEPLRGDASGPPSQWIEYCMDSLRAGVN